MPSPAKTKTICVFGDSHIGCTKLALKEGLFVPPKDVQFEFWGAAGPMFRELNYRDGKIVPSKEALPSVLAVNPQGRETLAPNDYDAILFMAARIRSLNIFEPELHRMQQTNGFVSEAVFIQNCADWLRSQKFYKVAKEFAQNSDCKIFIAPTTFLTQGAAEENKQYPDSKLSNVAGVDRIWTVLENTAKEDGISLIRQPADTCGDGCTSSPEYDRINLDGSVDVTHRNPKYGALILQQVIGGLT